MTRLGGHLLEELNVKALDWVLGGEGLVSYSLRPVLPKLGPKYGKEMGALRAALAALDPAEAAKALAAGQSLRLQLGDRTVALLPDEVEVMASAQEGRATAEQDGYVVEIDQTLTPDLVAEGLARDLVRQIQELRKQAGLELSDRIQVHLQAAPEIEKAARVWQEFLKGETLAEALHLGAALPEAAIARAELRIEGREAVLGLTRA